MKRILLFALATSFVAGVSAQVKMIEGDNRFTTQITPANATHWTNTRATGQYVLDYEAYDASLGQIKTGVYSNLAFNQPIAGDTGRIPFVAEYYDSLIFSQDGATWDALPWANVAAMTIDSIFIILNVDNVTGANNTLTMGITGAPTIGSSGFGNTYNFNNVLWTRDSVINSDIGSTTPTTVTFDVFSFAPGISVTNKFAVTFAFDGPPTDTCRLRWSYPTDGGACAPAGPGANAPKEWELYPTSFYSIGINATESNNFPTISGARAFMYFTDCDAPLTPYLNDVSASGFDANKNQFQHWSISAVVTITDNLGLQEQAEKGIKVFAYPVPAMENTNISFTLKEDAQHVTLTLTDLSGRVVANRVLGSFAAGKNQVTVDTDFPSGVYTYTLNVDGTSITRKFVIGK